MEEYRGCVYDGVSGRLGDGKTRKTTGKRAAIDRRHLHRLIYVIGVGVGWGGVKEKKSGREGGGDERTRVAYR